MKFKKLENIVYRTHHPLVGSQRAHLPLTK